MEFRSLVQRVTTPFLLLSITGRFTEHSRTIFANNRRIFRLTGRSFDQRLPTMSRLGRFAGYPRASNRVPGSDQRLGIGVRISCSHWPYRYDESKKARR